MVMRVSPKNLLSKGFKVLEKQKHKQQQQRPQENLMRAMPPPPPRPAAAKRKDVQKSSAIPETIKGYGAHTAKKEKLKVRFEKDSNVHPIRSKHIDYLSREMPKLSIIREERKFHSSAGLSESGDSQKDVKLSSKRQHRESSSPAAVSLNEVPSKSWKESTGFTCSVNKAQEDNDREDGHVPNGYDEIIPTAPQIKAEISVSEEVAMESVTHEPVNMKLADFVTPMDVEVHVPEREETCGNIVEKDGREDDILVSPDHTVYESTSFDLVEKDTEKVRLETGSLTVSVSHLPMEEPEDVRSVEEKAGDGSCWVAVGAITAESAADIGEAENPTASKLSAEISAISEAFLPRQESQICNEEESHLCVDPEQSMDNIQPTSPLNSMHSDVPIAESNVEESEDVLGDRAEILKELSSKLEVLSEVVHEHLVSIEHHSEVQQASCNDGSTILNEVAACIVPHLVERHIDVEEGSKLQAEDESRLYADEFEIQIPAWLDSEPVICCSKGEIAAVTCAVRQQEDETAICLGTDASKCMNKREEEEEKEKVSVSTIGDVLQVKKQEGQEISSLQKPLSKRERLLAELDGRADKLFRRMFAREGFSGWDVDEDDRGAAVSKVCDKLTPDDLALSEMEVDMELTSMPLSRVVSPKEIPAVAKQCCFPNVINKEEDKECIMVPSADVGEMPHSMPHTGVVHEMQEMLDRTSQGQEEMDYQKICSQSQQAGDPSLADLKSGAVEEQEQPQNVVRKSSKEDGEWDEDLDDDVPEFTFGNVSGITQRVKAPGRCTNNSNSKPVDMEEEDGACVVCQSSDGEPSDPIVFCDGCDVAVHANCYGNPLHCEIPEGDWFCAQCMSNSPEAQKCCLCPALGGAMKKTIDGKWAHISCAVFVPEVFFRSADDREPIDTTHVPNHRWISVCSVCKATGGACVDCTEIGCVSSFHVSCALEMDLAMEFRNGRGGAIVISFCEAHTARWNQQQESKKDRRKFKIVSREPRESKAPLKSKVRT